MVYRLKLTYNDLIDKLDVTYISGSTIGYTIPPGVCEVKEINLMLKFLIFGKVKLYIAIDESRLKSILTTNKTIRFNKKSSIFQF